MNTHATRENLDRVLDLIAKKGLRHHVYSMDNNTIIGVAGDADGSDIHRFEACDGVERVVGITHPFKLASRDFMPQSTVVKAGRVDIGGKRVVIMAGPCAVENRESIMETALAVQKAGALVLRGGAFKPRTSPYSFQGLGEEGLKMLKEAGEEYGLAVVSEVLSPEDVEMVSRHVDILQIGSRNAQNYPLLREAGRANIPVLLKRGMMSTIEEWLMSAEYIFSEGNPNVVFCERGIRTFETETRNTFDINAIPVIKSKTHLPIIADPSHGTGRWGLVGSIARAAVAAGADGLMIEVHANPEEARSDGAQSLLPKNFSQLMKDLRAVAEAVGRTL